MAGFGKGAGLARLVVGFVVVSLLLAACGSDANSATPVVQNVAAATVTNQIQTQLPANSPTSPITRTTTSPFSTVPVYSGLTKGKLKEMYPVLANLAEAKSFKVNDDWNGLSTDAPRIAHFSLIRKGNQFEGEAFYSIGGYSWVEDEDNPYFEATVAITIPLEVGQKFLQMLVDAPVEEGPSKNTRTTRVDNYPSLSMEIDTGYGLLEFNSLSSCCFVRTFTFGRNTFEGTDATAFDAFDLLKPYLRDDVQKSLYKQATPTPGKSTPTSANTPGLKLKPTVK
ncbi:MAG: hypothetical protein J0I20_34555 [Chloroflexi bacterium]|nr:hypothetical protein [Chloroflexota bacterium]